MVLSSALSSWIPGALGAGVSLHGAGGQGRDCQPEGHTGQAVHHGVHTFTQWPAGNTGQYETCQLAIAMIVCISLCLLPFIFFLLLFYLVFKKIFNVLVIFLYVYFICILMQCINVSCKLKCYWQFSQMFYRFLFLAEFMFCCGWSCRVWTVSFPGIFWPVSPGWTGHAAPCSRLH